ncbi:PREDICTED: glycerol-3-phosphate dehydrogenase, mitochondrial-like isoform X2 [Priapulus caudatus]|uniref:Glycerol-3-phosphate dehydrogenase n=1 Tax=Priapulus caudatus TaxID=37621 RepID=A0ABM1DVA4_PRICU|nr:PREDICTED: glycerol-3-phosphate dehydrogenase, mitochondrial-like isoform X2 [Priapulus caudatus]
MAYRYTRKLFGAGLILGGSGACIVYANRRYQNQAVVLAKTVNDGMTELNQRPTVDLPTRAAQLKSLEQTAEFDVLVIGGGATGCGVALDAVSRGLSTAVVERQDFSAGTSSRSTKLIHGGVRYLQKAILRLDYEQYRMVKEALQERANLLKIAPHLSYPLPIMLPVYKWWQIPYYWAGIKAYDIVAGRQKVKTSYFLSKSRALELFPMLKKDKLVGALVYYDGQHNDARMNVAIALTAARLGGTVANHVEVLQLLKKADASGKRVVCGALCRDTITGKEFEVRAKCVINATGPFTDFVRKLDNPHTKNICQPSSGVHIILPDYYSPDSMGLLDPSTSDGRVIFFLPWEKVTIAGTTDQPCEVTHNPSPTEAEIQFILNEIRNYLSPDVEVRRGDVLAAWSGIRPLVLDPNAKSTEAIARNHVIIISDSNLVTIAGGKWTTYRHMAEEAVDAAIKACGLEPPPHPSRTSGLLLEGAHEYSPTMFIRLVQDFGLESEVAKHLAHDYGDRAFDVAKSASLTGKRWPVVGKRLHVEYPYIEAEVRWAMKEYACTAVDVISRRLRLAFLNHAAAKEALPQVIEVMTKELGWSKQEQQRQMDYACEFLNTEMGAKLGRGLSKVPINFSREEFNMYVTQFKNMDTQNKGHITVNDLREMFTMMGEPVMEAQLHEILSEVDVSRHGKVELGEFLQLMTLWKEDSTKGPTRTGLPTKKKQF